MVDRTRREHAVSAYWYLCCRGARRFFRRGLERSDLEQVASIGLLKACDRYDDSMDTPFEAFAWLYIVGELMHHVRDHERLMRTPRKLRDRERDFIRTIEHLTAELGREPSEREIASSMNLDGRTVRELFEARTRAAAESLDALNERHADRIDEAEAAVGRVMLDRALQELSETERKIVLGVYHVGLSQAELAHRLGYSQRHISRLHRAALQKMLPLWVR